MRGVVLLLSGGHGVLGVLSVFWRAGGWRWGGGHVTGVGGKYVQWF